MSSGAFFLFALRDLLRSSNRLESLFSFVVLLLVVLVIAVPLLFFQGLSQTAVQIFDRGPSLVVRRVEPAGFATVAVQESLKKLSAVRGVIRAEARLWGVTQSSDGPVTIVGVHAPTATKMQESGLDVPSSTKVVIGSGLTRGQDTIDFGSRQFQIASVLPGSADLFANDVVLMTWEEAAEILGVPDGYATDVALWVFHESEQEAIVGDLINAVHWPANIVNEQQASKAFLSDVARRSGLSLSSSVPALLALILLTIVSGRSGGGTRSGALLKVLGWTTVDIVKWRLFRALCIGLPALSVGFALASAIVFWPGIPGLGELLFGWRGSPQTLFLEGNGAFLIILILSGVILVPWITGALWPAIRLAIADPGEMLEGGGPT